MSDLKVDVVLTAYKKIDTLQQQIDAIKNQTYKISNLYLFKDGIDSYYDIVLKESIINQFNDVKVASNNIGVWGRFEYAYNICKSDFVCIFDDDTIPGTKWIENCINNFKVQPGVYGTNGILAKQPETYPYNMINVGWHNPNRRTIQVDFVGHSWFFRKEWLKWMLDVKEKYDYKYVGEDMALSFVCQQHGISTYVPPHPFGDVQMWGSKPLEGKKYGMQSAALSLNYNNLESMNKAIINMKNDGWHFLLENDDNYFEDIKGEFETEENKKKIIEQDLIDFMNKSNNVYLYGAGKYGISFYRYLKMYKKKISGFVVTIADKSNINIDGQNIEIIDLEQLNRMKGVSVILSLNPIYHCSIREKIDSSISVFMETEKTYDYNDVFYVINQSK